MGFMTIDGRKVEFTDEKMSFLSFATPVSTCQPCAIIPRFPLSAPVVCVPWRMTEAEPLPPALRFQGMAW